MHPVHISPFGGAWYPEQPSALQALLDEAFERSRQRTGPFLFPHGLGYVTPHAGPKYSGTVAAAVYRSLEQQKPLGEVPIDREFAP